MYDLASINLTEEQFDDYYTKHLEISKSFDNIIDSFSEKGYNRDYCKDIFLMTLITNVVIEAKFIDYNIEQIISAIRTQWKDA